MKFEHPPWIYSVLALFALPLCAVLLLVLALLVVVAVALFLLLLVLASLGCLIVTPIMPYAVYKGVQTYQQDAKAKTPDIDSVIRFP